MIKTKQVKNYINLLFLINLDKKNVWENQR